MAAERTGQQCTLFRNTGTWSSPTWNQVDACIDVTSNAKYDEANFSSRISGFKKYKPALNDLSVETTLIWNRDDADCQAIRDAFVNKTVLDIWAVDDIMVTGSVVTGGQGWRYQANVFEFARDEPLSDGVKVKVTFKPTTSPTDFREPEYKTA